MDQFRPAPPINQPIPQTRATWPARYRDLVVTQREDAFEVNQRGGLDAVIASQLASFRDNIRRECIEPNPLTGIPSAPLAVQVEGAGDLVVWEGVNVVAVLRPTAAGDMVVIRLDGKAETL